jgi:hypothetical protein
MRPSTVDEIKLWEAGTRLLLVKERNAGKRQISSFDKAMDSTNTNERPWRLERGCFMLLMKQGG